MGLRENLSGNDGIEHGLKNPFGDRPPFQHAESMYNLNSVLEL